MSSPATNEMLLEYLREMKKDINARFEQIDKRFETINQEFEKAHEERRDIKYDLRLDQKRLEEVYDTRKQVTVKFSQAFAGINMVLAGFVSFFTAFLVK